MTETAESLVAEYLRIKDFLAAEAKRFADFGAPHKARMDAIENQLMAMLVQQQLDSVRANSGTAYISRLLNTKVENRDALLDFCTDRWDEIGNELLMVSAQKDAVKSWMDAHDGTPPPGITISWFNRVNIRRS